MRRCVHATVLRSQDIAREEQVQNKTVLFAGGALALTGSFRVSMAPFLVSGFLALLYFARSKVRWRHVVIFLVVVFVGMIPSFIYNFVRMGSPLRPATTASQYDVVNALIGNPVLALFGLTFSPNRGIFLFAPKIGR